MNIVEEHLKKEKEQEYYTFCSRMERVLDKKVHDDLIETGRYLDDEIGEDRFVEAVDAVKESLYKTLWDCYDDVIGDIIMEEA